MRSEVIGDLHDPYGAICGVGMLAPLAEKYNNCSRCDFDRQDRVIYRFHHEPNKFATVPVQPAQGIDADTPPGS
jgi:hypothetical protein